MRYSDRVSLKTKIEGGYNPETGRHEPPQIVSITLPCNVTSLGIDRKRELFGDIDRELVVVRLQQPHDRPFDYAEINFREYRLNQKVNHRPRTVFYLEEMS